MNNDNKRKKIELHPPATEFPPKMMKREEKPADKVRRGEEGGGAWGVSAAIPPFPLPPSSLPPSTTVPPTFNRF